MLDYIYCNIQAHILYVIIPTIPSLFIIYDNNDLHICSFMQKRYVIYTQCICSIVKYGISMLSYKMYE